MVGRKMRLLVKPVKKHEVYSNSTSFCSRKKMGKVGGQSCTKWMLRRTRCLYFGLPVRLLLLVLVGLFSVAGQAGLNIQMQLSTGQFSKEAIIGSSSSSYESTVGFHPPKELAMDSGKLTGVNANLSLPKVMSSSTKPYKPSSSAKSHSSNSTLSSNSSSTSRNRKETHSLTTTPTSSSSSKASDTSLTSSVSNSSNSSSNNGKIKVNQRANAKSQTSRKPLPLKKPGKAPKTLQKGSDDNDNDYLHLDHRPHHSEPLKMSHRLDEEFKTSATVPVVPIQLPPPNETIHYHYTDDSGNNQGFLLDDEEDFYDSFNFGISRDYQQEQFQLGKFADTANPSSSTHERWEKSRGKSTDTDTGFGPNSHKFASNPDSNYDNNKEESNDFDNEAKYFSTLEGKGRVLVNKVDNRGSKTNLKKLRALNVEQSQQAVMESSSSETSPLRVPYSPNPYLRSRGYLGRKTLRMIGSKPKTSFNNHDERENNDDKGEDDENNEDVGDDYRGFYDQSPFLPGEKQHKDSFSGSSKASLSSKHDDKSTDEDKAERDGLVGEKQNYYISNKMSENTSKNINSNDNNDNNKGSSKKDGSSSSSGIKKVRNELKTNSQEGREFLRENKNNWERDSSKKEIHSLEKQFSIGKGSPSNDRISISPDNEESEEEYLENLTREKDFEFESKKISKKGKSKGKNLSRVDTISPFNEDDKVKDSYGGNSTVDNEGENELSFEYEGDSSDGEERSLMRRRPRRSVVHLYDMVVCATGCNPLAYKGYGCYCGFLGSGLTVDGIDRCCAKHDWCYHHAKCPPLLTYFVPYYWTCNDGRPKCVTDYRGWKGVCGANLCECDRQFAECLRKFPCPRSRAMCMTSPWRFWQNLLMAPPMRRYRYDY